MYPVHKVMKEIELGWNHGYNTRPFAGRVFFACPVSLVEVQAGTSAVPCLSSRGD